MINRTSFEIFREEGFTLVELMIALAMSGIIVAAVYAAYNVQNKSYYAQGQVVEMQQNLRAAMEVIANDIRIATYGHESDPADCTVDQATSNQLRVRLDDNNDGSCDVTNLNNENVQYDLNANVLRRNTQPLAENIEAIEFCYKLIDKSDDNCTTAPADFSDIQAVQVSILARAENRDAKFNNSEEYFPASCYGATGGLIPGCANKWGPFKDEIRRRLLINTVHIRNRGL